MSKIQFLRRKTRVVYVGQVAVGGNHPIRVQSMCTSDTKNTNAVVSEMQRIVAAGCEIIRVTVPTKADCDNLKNIRAEMARRGLKVPLVADIHFTPSIAMEVVDFVEKVRINPGNFVDKKLFKSREYTDAEYSEELAHIAEKFIPLVRKCKERGVAMRIGTNHGSLSDRIMNRYGDTVEGMVESALEFLRLAREENYHDIVLSMKASNPQVMITAYRQLAQKLDELGWDYPFHLGVTEAGEGEDARVKSALGIGTLLEEGIGDTIRVSLTEDSEHEVPVAMLLAQTANQKQSVTALEADMHKNEIPRPQFASKDFSASYERRQTVEIPVGQVPHGNQNPPRVWTRVTPKNFDEFLKSQNVDIRFEGVEISPEHASPDFITQIRAQGFAIALHSPQMATLIESQGVDKLVWEVESLVKFEQDFLQLLQNSKRAALEICLDVDRLDLGAALTQIAQIAREQGIILSLKTAHPFRAHRQLATELNQRKIKWPVHLRYTQGMIPAIIDASIKLGAQLVDGFGDSIQMTTPLGFKENLNLSYAILQATRTRISKTEFIACPSCGRTLFDLQDVTARIKAKTSHLKGVKIAIMGCIVNGPGEMADADFGYVGTGTGKISLYVGKNCVQRNLPEENALENLIGLIREHGKWVEAGEQQK